MRRYETVFIVHSDLSSDELNSLVERYQSIITSLKGIIIRLDNWGKRRLAYPIEKRREGTYIFVEFASDNDAVFEMERNFKIDERIMRYLTVKLSDHVDPVKLEEELAAAAAKREAQAQAQAAAQVLEESAAEGETHSETPVEEEPAPESPAPEESAAEVKPSDPGAETDTEEKTGDE
ncbi:MAG: 30S ribosomal protein S6 [Deltaproteobacteria bacterium]|nr:30S ribosomal protein S6 [Deltaproteobacteria bacterium]